MSQVLDWCSLRQPFLVFVIAGVVGVAAAQTAIVEPRRRRARGERGR